MNKTRPICQLTGTDGNVFMLAAKVINALKKAGQRAEAQEFMDKLPKCESYDEALSLMMEYVEVR